MIVPAGGASVSTADMPQSTQVLLVLDGSSGTTTANVCTAAPGTNTALTFWELFS